MNVRSLLSLQKYYGKFVKEFGEGVNRMCNELEQVGLKGSCLSYKCIYVASGYL